VSVLIWIARALRTISGHADSIARTDSPRKFGTGPNLITTGERLGLTLALDTPIMGGVVEKLKPHYRLADIKAAFADPAKLNRTFSSKQGADALNMDDEAVVAVIQALAGSDFDKSMTSNVDHRIWQDVYRPKFGSTQLYVKFTLDAMNALLLISFKEA
jgi:motility quorum-sensing regulator/GCU-specific mRNA interferase toxin